MFTDCYAERPQNGNLFTNLSISFVVTITNSVMWESGTANHMQLCSLRLQPQCKQQKCLIHKTWGSAWKVISVLVRSSAPGGRLSKQNAVDQSVCYLWADWDIDMRPGSLTRRYRTRPGDLEKEWYSLTLCNEVRASVWSKISTVVCISNYNNIH